MILLKLFLMSRINFLLSYLSFLFLLFYLYFIQIMKQWNDSNSWEKRFRNIPWLLKDILKNDKRTMKIRDDNFSKQLFGCKIILTTQPSPIASFQFIRFPVNHPLTFPSSVSRETTEQIQIGWRNSFKTCPIILNTFSKMTNVTRDKFYCRIILNVTNPSSFVVSSRFTVDHRSIPLVFRLYATLVSFVKTRGIEFADGRKEEGEDRKGVVEGVR